jgi:hypothetical protein
MISSTTSALLNRLAKFGADSLRTEFIAQGHDATGHTVNNIRAKVEPIKGGVELSFWAPEYATKLNNWQSPSTIHINEWRLRVWMSLPTRGIEQKAYHPITAAMMREGIPTKGSFKFSKNGRRTGWIREPFDKFIAPSADELADNLAAQVVGEISESLIANLRDL